VRGTIGGAGYETVLSHFLYGDGTVISVCCSLLLLHKEKKEPGPLNHVDLKKKKKGKLLQATGEQHVGE